MITERVALARLMAEVPPAPTDPHNTYYPCLQEFANLSVEFCDGKEYRTLERFMRVAFNLFKDGNATVPNGIFNVYLFTLS